MSRHCEGLRVQDLGFKALRYLGGSGGLSNVTIWVIGVINLLTKSSDLQVTNGPYRVQHLLELSLLGAAWILVLFSKMSSLNISPKL